LPNAHEFKKPCLNFTQLVYVGYNTRDEPT
jgi:hypothetical protein